MHVVDTFFHCLFSSSTLSRLDSRLCIAIRLNPLGVASWNVCSHSLQWIKYKLFHGTQQKTNETKWRGKKSLIRSQALHDMQCLFMLCGWRRHKHTHTHLVAQSYHPTTGVAWLRVTNIQQQQKKCLFSCVILLIIIRVHWQWMKSVDTWSEARASCAHCREYIFVFCLCDKLWPKSNYMMKTILEGQKLNKNRKDNSNSITPTVNHLVTSDVKRRQDYLFITHLHRWCWFHHIFE